MRKSFVLPVALSAILSACGGGGGSSSNDGGDPPPPPFEATADVGFVSIFVVEPAVAFEIASNGHPITVTRQQDAEGDEKLYFHFENQPGEDIDGAENMGVDSAIFPVVYHEDDGIVCIQAPAGYSSHTNDLIGDVTATGVTFQQCASDVIQAADISEDWTPTLLEGITGTQVVSTFITDPDGITVGNISATTDLDGDVRLYISDPFNAAMEALVDVDRGIICADYISTAMTGAFMTRVTGTNAVSTDGLDQYLGSDLVRDKVIFISDCNYDIAEWQ
ncbi:MAG: hypothetical protein KZQ73_03920 [Candidatus Thiodiazotropha sp. (ex Semelilucina semeliformis)]|nr:hypothetical protein [Candidatus Thiodiazotropha sp. (ex Semelilucina semeliformis)]